MLDTDEGRQFELEVVDSLLNRDLRNNSAWNHRWFVMHSALGAKEALSDEVQNVVWGGGRGGMLSLFLEGAFFFFPRSAKNHDEYKWDFVFEDSVTRPPYMYDRSVPRNMGTLT